MLSRIVEPICSYKSLLLKVGHEKERILYLSGPINVFDLVQDAGDVVIDSITMPGEASGIAEHGGCKILTGNDASITDERSKACNQVGCLLVALINDEERALHSRMHWRVHFWMKDGWPVVVSHPLGGCYHSPDNDCRVLHGRLLNQDALWENRSGLDQPSADLGSFGPVGRDAANNPAARDDVGALRETCLARLGDRDEKAELAVGRVKGNYPADCDLVLKVGTDVHLHVPGTGLGKDAGHFVAVAWRHDGDGKLKNSIFAAILGFYKAGIRKPGCNLDC